MIEIPFRTALFLRDEAGAVTVDWTVISAALIGLALATVGVVSTGLERRSENYISATETWRYGRHASANYDAQNPEGFALAMENFDNLSPDEIAAFNGYLNAARAGGAMNDPGTSGGAFFTDVDAAWAAHYAENRSTRPEGAEFDGAAVNDINTNGGLGAIAAQYDYGTGGGLPTNF